jgi:hypothetical protein
MDNICFANETGATKYEVNFSPGHIHIKIIVIGEWGKCITSFNREVEGRKIMWRPTDLTDKMLEITPEIKVYIDKLAKLRTFL